MRGGWRLEWKPEPQSKAKASIPISLEMPLARTLDTVDTFEQKAQNKDCYGFGCELHSEGSVQMGILKKKKEHFFFSKILSIIVRGSFSYLSILCSGGQKHFGHYSVCIIK